MRKTVYINKSEQGYVAVTKDPYRGVVVQIVVIINGTPQIMDSWRVPFEGKEGFKNELDSTIALGIQRLAELSKADIYLDAIIDGLLDIYKDAEKE